MGNERKGNQRGTWREEIRIVEGAWEVGCWVFGGVLLCTVVNVLFNLYVEGQLRLGTLSSSMFGVGKYDVFVLILINPWVCLKTLLS